MSAPKMASFVSMSACSISSYALTQGEVIRELQWNLKNG